MSLAELVATQPSRSAGLPLTRALKMTVLLFAFIAVASRAISAFAPDKYLWVHAVGQLCMIGVLVLLTIDMLVSTRHSERLRGVGSVDDAQATAMRLELPLLSEVNKGFSDGWWSNYRALITKRDDGSIAGDEMRELMALTDTLEEVNVRRMACFASASKLLGMSLDELMAKANLKPKLA